MLCSSFGDSLPLFLAHSSRSRVTAGLLCLVHAMSWEWVAPVTGCVGQTIHMNCGSQSKPLGPSR